MSHDHDSETAHEPVGYGTYFITWFALIVMTAITVTAAGMHFGALNVLVALVIAATKATIVLYFFMHLKYETRIFHLMLFIVLVALATFIGLTFTDVIFR